MTVWRKQGSKQLKQVLVITVHSVPRLSRAEQENHQRSLTTITERRQRRKRENMCHTVNKGVHRGIWRDTYYTRGRALEKTTETAADLISTRCAYVDVGDGQGYDISLDVKRECIDQTSESGEAEPLQWWSEEWLFHSSWNTIWEKMPGKTFTLLQYYLATVVDKCWNQFTTWKFFLKTTLDVEPTAIRYCASCLNL